MTAPAQTAPAKSGPRALLTEKRGPLPVWAWLALGLALLLGVVLWRRNRASAGNAVATGDDDEVGGDQTAPAVFIIPPGPAPVVNINGVETAPAAPPGAGSPPPGVPSTPGPVPNKNPGPKAPPKAPPKKPAPKAYETVSVKRYTNSNPPWQSTLSGIASHFGISDWHKIWNDPKNVGIRNARKDPKFIRPDDKIYVPTSLIKKNG